MARFMKTTDYDGYIKADIRQMISGANDTLLIRAEDTAVATVTEYLGGRYDCAAIFTPASGNTETRNLHIVKVVRSLALFDLYHQTGATDIPEHRKMAYDDAISWLKDAGRGDIKTTLPMLAEEVKASDFRMNSRVPRKNKW